MHIAKNSTGGDRSGNLYLHDAGGQASGGHVANAIVEGSISLGSQQQFCFRSVSFANKVPKEDLGVWSFMFVGCVNAPDERDGVSSNPFGGWESNPSVAVENPKITIEKPFVILNEEKYELHIPSPRKKDGREGFGFRTLRLC